MKIAGETFLSAATYVLAGSGIAPGVLSTAKPVPVTLRTVWKLETKNGVLTKEYPIYDKGVLTKTADVYLNGLKPSIKANTPVYADTVSGCTLSNAVKEVFYTVQSVPTPIEQIGYQIAAVNVDIII